jgi:hypothetical protein
MVKVSNIQTKMQALTCTIISSEIQQSKNIHYYYLCFRLIDNAVMAGMNMKGHGGKVPFGETETFKIVKGKQINQNYTICDMLEL